MRYLVMQNNMFDFRAPNILIEQFDSQFFERSGVELVYYLGITSHSSYCSGFWATKIK